MLVLKCSGSWKFFGFLLVSFGYLSTAWAQDAESQQAEIVIEVRSESSATRGKNYKVTYYQDEQCGKRGRSDKVFEKKYAKNVHVFNPLKVDTDSNFIFQVAYTEKRRAETRSCTYIANVALEAGRNYKAVYEIVDEVVGCGIKVFDVTDVLAAESVSDVAENDDVQDDADAVKALAEPVEMQIANPEFMCDKVGKQGYKNGTPIYQYKDRLG